MGQSHINNKSYCKNEKDQQKIIQTNKQSSTVNKKDKLPEILKGPEHFYHDLKKNYCHVKPKRVALAINRSGVKFVRIWCDIATEPHITLAMYHYGYKRLSSNFNMGNPDYCRCWADFEKL